MFVKTDRKDLISVGVDIGSSTSHVVFSRITLEKDPMSRSEKFEVADREVLHSGRIHLTPFSDPYTIDFERLEDLLLTDYEQAGFEVTDIDTGAVIVTGETAKKQNAAQIVNALAGETGKFVSATAGPNFEAVLAAHGSGAVSRSERTGETVMNVDIGGGSSNIAICSCGRVIDTSAINVGGRLVAFDEENVITRLEDTGRAVAQLIGLDLRLGGVINESEKQLLAETLASALREAMRGKPTSPASNLLMMTETLREIEGIDVVTFSGGVAEFIYGEETRHFGDLGPHLATAINAEILVNGFRLDRPDHRIRATVIGAGQCSLQVSGSTTFLTSGLSYPLRNLPVVVPQIPRNNGSAESVRHAIREALTRFDLQEGEDSLILAFQDAVRPSYERLTEFSKGVVHALPKTVDSGKPIMMCFDTDVGNSVGNVMKRETGIQNEILSIDEVLLSEGDFVDIGEPIIEGVVVPVVVKTLVFESN
ncbi:ethanolamine utilization protein EutA [Candidatus Thorarchaeota archaeon]|nr:MAG: ethanolamine utilization protein EutA [Candidatus Thorarchaeota archaeon]